MTAPSSCPDNARLRQLLDGVLPPDEQADLQNHLETCEPCLRRLEGLVAGHESWSDAARHLSQETPAPGPGLQEAVAALAGGAERLETQDEPAGPEMKLDFLSPSVKPGHIGRLGPCEILDVIGRGGMGIVLKALDEGLNRIVAIKVLASQWAANATARQRFEREARAAAAVSHEHVVAIHAVDEANGVPYLVMQYIEGVSLQQRLDRGGPMQVKEILRIGMQTAAGLAAAHAQGLIHRDVKPANILLENGVERVKLTDFGLARAIDDASLTQSGVIAGTPQYMSPEQADGLAVDHRSDLFSLGSVLYAMCTGRPPFRASTVMGVLKRVSEDEPRPVREVNPDVPDWLEDIIAKLHAKLPEDRFQSATEVADLLGQHLAHLQQPGQVARPASLPRPSTVREPKQRRILPWVAVAALLLLLPCCLLLPVGVLGLLLGWTTLNRADEDARAHVSGQVPWVSEEAADSGKSLPQQDSFVVLTHEGIEKGQLNRLDMAIAFAESGDTIEIRGNGHHRTDPIEIRGKVLTIRAGAGFAPTIGSIRQGEKPDVPLLQTDSPLVLEGLAFEREVQFDAPLDIGPWDIQRIGGGRVEEVNEIVRSLGTSLHAANCRFRLYGGQHCITAWGLATCEVRNCQFLGGCISGVDWYGAPRGRLVIENCLQTSQVGLAFHCRHDTADTSIRLAHNTFRGCSPLVLVLDGLPAGAADGPAQQPVQVEAVENVWHGWHMLRLHQSDVFLSRAKQLPQRGQSVLPRLVRWRDERNLYAGLAQGYLVGGGIQHVADWVKFWGLSKTGSLQGKVRFAGGDDLSRHGQSNLANFRLHGDSLGHGAGKDGRDLGANVDLVGPGEAYERWKKTPAYQQWLRGSGLNKP
jgi:serine/threonine protein kinase